MARGRVARGDERHVDEAVAHCVEGSRRRRRVLGQHLELDPPVGRLLHVGGPHAQHVARQVVRGRYPARHREHGLRLRRNAEAAARRPRRAARGSGRPACIRLRRPSRPSKSVSSPARPTVQCLPAWKAVRAAPDSTLTLNAMTSRLPSLGFVGLGVMGRPMAGHLAAAGHAMTLYDVAPGLAQSVAATLADRGAHVAATPAELAARSDIVITMVPNGVVVQELACGDDGLLRGFRPGALLLDTSSSEPWLTEATGRRSPPRGVAMVDAPVSGAQWGAEAAELVFMCGGAEADLERVRPLLDVMGKAVFHLGSLGAGHAMKCLNNLDHGDELPRRHRRARDRQALRARSGGDGRRAQRVDRHVVDFAHAHASARHQPQLRRSVQARADAEGHRHRDAAGEAHRRSGAALCPRPAALARRRPRRSARSQRQRAGALGRADRPGPRSPPARRADRPHRCASSSPARKAFSAARSSPRLAPHTRSSRQTAPTAISPIRRTTRSCATTWKPAHDHAIEEAPLGDRHRRPRPRAAPRLPARDGDRRRGHGQAVRRRSSASTARTRRARCRSGRRPTPRGSASPRRGRRGAVHHRSRSPTACR